MQIVPPDANGIERALEILRGGGVVAHATETCYGLACDVKNIDAVAQLFRIKQRPSDQPVSALFSSIEEATQYVEWNSEAEKLAKQHLPGPLTLILPMILPLHVTAMGTPATIGIRISSHPLAMTLVKKFGSPLSTTSANIHGQPNPYSADDIVKQFESEKEQPDLILDSGTLPKTPPSTIVDLSRSSSTVLRQGALKSNFSAV